MRCDNSVQQLKYMSALGNGCMQIRVGLSRIAFTTHNKRSHSSRFLSVALFNNTHRRTTKPHIQQIEAAQLHIDDYIISDIAQEWHTHWPDQQTARSNPRVTLEPRSRDKTSRLWAFNFAPERQRTVTTMRPAIWSQHFHFCRLCVLCCVDQDMWMSSGVYVCTYAQLLLVFNCIEWIRGNFPRS